MDYEKIGSFICQCRKEKNLTQKALAQQLNITDKAVSKWERGLSCPDIALLTPLAAILDVTISQLLNGTKDPELEVRTEATVDKALDYSEQAAAEKMRKIQFIAFISTSISFLLAILTTLICDYYLFKELSWSLIVMAALVFSWLALLPFFRAKPDKIRDSLIIISVLVVPFLFILSIILDNKTVFTLGSITAVPSLILIWLSYFILRRMPQRKIRAVGFICLCAVPFTLVINWLVYLTLGGEANSLIDVATNFIALLILGIIFLAWDYWRHNG